MGKINWERRKKRRKKGRGVEVETQVVGVVAEGNHTLTIFPRFLF